MWDVGGGGGGVKPTRTLHIKSALFIYKMQINSGRGGGGGGGETKHSFIA